MPRDPRKVEKRAIMADPKYNSKLVARFVNKLMIKGKKSTAFSIIYKTFSIIEKKLQKDPLEVFEQAIKNVSPVVQVRPRRIGGATYQVPIEVKKDRKLILAIQWIIGAARSKKGQSMAVRLADELIDAANNTGIAIKKKEDTHRMAEANRAFAHYARF